MSLSDPMRGKSSGVGDDVLNDRTSAGRLSRMNADLVGHAGAVACRGAVLAVEICDVRSGKDSCLGKYASATLELVSQHSNPE
jgi:hypothetical protein